MAILLTQINVHTRQQNTEYTVSHMYQVSALLHAVIKLLGLVFTLPAVHSIFDGSLAQFHLHSSYSLTWCAYGSRRCFYGYGYTGACNSSGTRIINVGCVKDLRARHLASTDAAITRRRSCTHQGPNCVCSPTCCRG